MPPIFDTGPGKSLLPLLISCLSNYFDMGDVLRISIFETALMK